MSAVLTSQGPWHVDLDDEGVEDGLLAGALPQQWAVGYRDFTGAVCYTNPGSPSYDLTRLYAPLFFHNGDWWATELPERLS